MTKRKAVITALIGGALTVLGPVSGVVLSALLTSRAFSTAASVPAQARAAHVASGIDSAMHCTIAGGVVGAAGLVTVVVAVILLMRASPTPVPARL